MSLQRDKVIGETLEAKTAHVFRRDALAGAALACTNFIPTSPGCSTASWLLHQCGYNTKSWIFITQYHLKVTSTGSGHYSQRLPAIHCNARRQDSAAFSRRPLQPSGPRATRSLGCPHLLDQRHHVCGPGSRVHHCRRPEHVSDFVRGSAGANVIRPLKNATRKAFQFIFSASLGNLFRAKKLQTKPLCTFPKPPIASLSLRDHSSVEINKIITSARTIITRYLNSITGSSQNPKVRVISQLVFAWPF